MKLLGLDFFRQLGWKYSYTHSMNNYYIFVRKSETLIIDTNKNKIIYYEKDKDNLPSISFDTLYVIDNFLKLNHKGRYITFKKD